MRKGFLMGKSHGSVLQSTWAMSSKDVMPKKRMFPQTRENLFFMKAPYEPALGSEEVFPCHI